MAEKGLPVNIGAERFVLGSVQLDEMAMHAARPVLAPDDFSLEMHQKIWKRACTLYDRGERVDRVTLANELNMGGELESVGGFSYLVALDDGLPILPSIDAYVKILKDKSLLRRIIFAAQHVMKRALSGTEVAQDVLDGFGETALNLIPSESSAGLQSVKALVDELGITALLSPRRERGLMFPWSWMNASTCGMLPAELWVLAAHTSNGKTSAMIQHAVNAARNGKGVAIFSLEVGKGSLFAKACAQLARVDTGKVRSGRMSPEEHTAMRQAAEELYGLPLYFDTQSSTAMAIHAAVRRMKTVAKIDHVIVDYLQLLGNSSRHGSRAEAVGANAWAMKMLATDFQVPVLLLSQFSRESAKPGKEGASPREPCLTDLKESGDIENHSNGVWAIHRESYEDVEQAPVKFMLLKQREGRRNIHKNLVFLPRYQRFEELTPYEEDWSDR